VQKHVLDHLRDFVREHAVVIAGVVFDRDWRGNLEPLVSQGMRLHFYVEPRTRTLMLAPIVPRKNRNRNQPDPNRRVISTEFELRRINGVWYEITLLPIPDDELARGRCYDVVERALLTPARTNDLWQSKRYAAKKRQLSTDEIIRHSLRRRR
jgi:hypothetical protein